MDIKHRYTDIKYLSPTELEKKSTEIYKEELEYRNKRSFGLSLEDFKHNELRITQTPWILQKEIKLILANADFQKNLLYEIGGSYNMKVVMKELLDKTIINELSKHKESFGIKLGKLSIEQMVKRLVKPKLIEEKELLEIIKSVEEVFTKYVEPKELALDLFDINDIETKITAENKSDISYKYYQTIEATMDEDINSPLVKLSMLLYMFDLFKFEKGISWKLILGLSMISYLGTNSMFETIVKIGSPLTVLKRHTRKLEDAARKARQSNGDVTFIYLELINIMNEMLDEAKAVISDIEATNIKEELSLKEKNLSLDGLMKKNPNLSMREARFYVAHNDDSEAYTIQDFIKYTNSSYETGRNSMDHLVEEGYYIKEKKGKKYVYKTS